MRCRRFSLFTLFLLCAALALQGQDGAAPPGDTSAQPPAASQPAAPAQPADAQPAAPAQPTDAQPAAPAQPTDAQPAAPAQPTDAQPAAPTQPAAPAQPAAPTQPADAQSAVPAQPADAQPAAPAQPAGAQPAVPAQPAATQPQVQPLVLPQTIPQELLRPQRGEAPRYPEDLVIGELGQGGADDNAYKLARTFAEGLQKGDKSAAGFSGLSAKKRDALLESLKVIDPDKYRMGGGRKEADGSTSFVFRFIGRQQWIAGELYLVEEGGKWRVDDIILEDPRDLNEGEEPYHFDFTPYQRFY